MNKMTETVRKRLLENADAEYRVFQAKLMPGVEPERIIGVRTPILRGLAKEFVKDPEIGSFLCDLPHASYDENNLHGFLIALQKDYAAATAYVNAFLPYVDNWATCDSLSPKVFYKNRPALKREILRWLSDEHPFTVRFGIEMIQTHFLDEDFDPDLMALVSRIRSEEYYVNMMIAWYFATALAKQWDAAIPYIKENRLADFAHNKAIQKAIESYRITDEQKTYLRTLKRKEKDNDKK